MRLVYAVPETEGRILHVVPLLEGLPVKSFPLILKTMLLFPSEVRVAWVFLGISLGLHPREIPQKTQATPPSDGKSIPPISYRWIFHPTILIYIGVAVH